MVSHISGLRPDYSTLCSSSSGASDQVSRSIDEQIQRIVQELNSVDLHGLFAITEENIKQFLDRGGYIQLLEEGQQIPLKRGERYIVGCGAGTYRSQVHAAYMERNGVRVDAILAGGDSAFNPKALYPMLDTTLYYDDSDKAAFKAHFGCVKRPQFGSEYNDGIQLDQQTLEMVPGVKDYYQCLVNQLEPTHFIAYGLSGPSVLMRLLGRHEESLKGFTLTFVNWAGPHPILYPPAGVAPYSQEAYRLSEERVAAHFPIVD